MKQVYKQVWTRGPYAANRQLIRRCDEILTQYWRGGEGFALTLRQLFYKLVVENAVANTPKAYESLGDVMTDARYAGMIDWDHIIDRSRGMIDWVYHDGEQAAIGALARELNINKWETQPFRVEIWLEKDAAIGTIESVATELRVPYGTTRGYQSTSGAKQGGERLIRHINRGTKILALHIADHDPSGWDMTRDLDERLRRFLDVDYALAHRDADPSLSMEDAMVLGREQVKDQLEIRRIALNRDQVTNLGLEEISQPVKPKDTRTPEYVKRFGRRCWELDALEPDHLAGLIRRHVLGVRDQAAWAATGARERQARANLALVRDSWPSVIDRLTEPQPSW